MSTIKEPHFFAKESVYSNGPGWHDQLFGSCSEEALWFGESSTLYSVWEPALERASRDLESPRVIVLLRKPVDRLLSHYRWLYSLGLERRALWDAVEAELAGKYDVEKSLSGNYPWYVRCSRYSYFCPLIESQFGAADVLFVRSEELASHPQVVLNACFDFLGLGAFSVSNQLTLNRTQEQLAQRTLGLNSLIRWIPESYRDQLDRGARMRRIVKRLLGKRRIPDAQIADSEVQRVSTLLKRDSEFFDLLPRFIA